MDELAYRQAGFGTKKHIKINYRQRSLEMLKKSGMTEKESVSFYNRAYSQALRSINKSARENLNVARELYTNLFIKRDEKSVFQLDSANNRIVLNELFAGSKDIAFERTLFNMQGFYEKFKDSPALQRIFNEYKTGTLSRTEFNAKIKEWKKLNIKYMISGSK